MPDYSNSIVYTIYDTSNSYEGLYVGSTVQTCARRFAQHKYHFERFLQKNSAYYCSSFDIFQNATNCAIKVIEQYPCKSSVELRTREEYWRKTLPHVISSKRAIRTRDDLRQDKARYHANHRVQHSESNAKWYSTKKDEILTRLNTKFICPCGGLYTHVNKQKHFRAAKHVDFVSKNPTIDLSPSKRE